MRWLAPAGLIGPLFLNLVLWLGGARRPGYDWASQFVSELSLGNQGWLQKTGFIVGGIGVFLSALGLRHAWDGGRWSRFTLFLVGAGACLVLAGLFDTDPIPVHLHFLSVAGFFHAFFALVLFVCLVSAGFDCSVRFANEPGWRYFTLVASCIATVAVAMVIVGFPIIERPLWLTLAPAEHVVGVSQRVAQAVMFIWLGAVSMRAALQSR